MINIIGDTHTHTVACGHATGTLTENAMYARRKGLRFVAITEHSGGVPEAPKDWWFGNLLRHVTNEAEGVVLLRGVETNIVSVEGRIDFPEQLMRKLDLVIASVHFKEVFEHGYHTAEDFTNMYCRVAENPLVDIIGHCGDPNFEYDLERMVRAFKENDKIVEINNSSPKTRRGSLEKCRTIIGLCKEMGVKIVVSSDAHAAQSVGNFDLSMELVREVDYPEQLILNADYSRFRHEMLQRRGLELPE